MSPFSAIPAVWQTVIPLVLFCEAVLELGLLLYQLLHSRMPLRSLPCAVHFGILVTLLLSVTQGDPNAGKDAFLIHAAWLFFCDRYHPCGTALCHCISERIPPPQK